MYNWSYKEGCMTKENLKKEAFLNKWGFFLLMGLLWWLSRMGR